MCSFTGRVRPTLQERSHHGGPGAVTSTLLPASVLSGCAIHWAKTDAHEVWEREHDEPEEECATSKQQQEQFSEEVAGDHEVALLATFEGFRHEGDAGTSGSLTVRIGFPAKPKVADAGVP